MGKKVLRVVFAFLLLNSAIAIHEFGHYAANEYYDVETEAISWGFGPELVDWDVGDIEFRISAIPLGAYVESSDAGVAKMQQLSRPKLFVIFGAGIFLNWVTPILALLLFSKKYRRFDKHRNKFPETLFRRELLETRLIKLPIIGPFHITRAIYAPMKNVPFKEEAAWKFNDLSKLLGFVNLVPILGMDGAKMLWTITGTQTGAFYLIMFIAWIVVWWNLWTEKNPPIYRRLM